MDGLTISTADSLLESGKTISELRKDRIQREQEIAESSGTSGKSFADTLKDAVHSVDDLQKTADHAMASLATGKTKNIPEVLITAEKADIAMKLMVQVRNKIIEAYQEVMKMQV